MTSPKKVSCQGIIRLGAQAYETPVLLEFLSSGAVEAHFPEQEYHPEFDFVLRGFHDDNEPPTRFILEAESEKHGTFHTNHLILNSASVAVRDGHSFAAIKSTIGYLFQESDANGPTDGQLVRYWLRGFESIYPFSKQTPLGRVIIRGSTKFSDYNHVGGVIELRRSLKSRALSLPWEFHAREFLDYLHRMMTFARCCTLYVAFCDSFRGAEATRTFYNPRKTQRPFIAPVHFMDSDPFYDCCIDTYFQSSALIDRIKYGIDWLIEPQHYSELRLVVRMMALENFVDQLLNKGERRRFPKIDFRRIRDVLSKQIYSVTNDQHQRDELRAALGNMNSKSLREKVALLIQKYKIPMDGLSKERIDAAISARNDVIHRGVYYRSEEPKQDRLWDHMVIINELLVRVVFQLIGYQGSYMSWLDGMAHRRFPEFETL